MSTSKKTKQTTAPKRTRIKTKALQMRVSQGGVAKTAIHNIELLFKKMGLSPKSVKSDKRRFLGTAGAPAKLIEEVAAAADQHGLLVGMAFDSNRAREALAFAAAFEPVATKAEAFAQRVRDSIIVAKGDVGSAALAVYAAMKGIVRRPEGAPLRDSFDKMTQIMKSRRKARVTTAKPKPAAPIVTTVKPVVAPTPPTAVNGAAANGATATAADKHSASTTVVITPPDA